MIRLCHIDNVKDGERLRIEPTDDIPVALLLVNVGGRFYCVEDVCSHRYTPLSGGTLEGHEIECPKHFSRFDLRTGKPDGLPARDPVATFEVTVHDNEVFVSSSAFQRQRDGDHQGG